jgi:adenylate cyclase
MPEAERRLAAILSADVVGYSRMMSENEEQTVRLLAAYRDQIGALVGEHRGRVVDFTGDNFLAEFRTGLDSVECAVEIQRVLRARNETLPDERKMEFRIGIHLGDIRVEADRVYGEGVNIAARLEALAEPGGICISATVHEQVRNRIEIPYDDLGDQAVKNIPDQVHVYRVRLDTPERAPVGPAGGSKLPRRLAIGAALLVALGLGLWWTYPRLAGMRVEAVLAPSAPALPDKPSLVVLPFVNMSGDPEQEYFADGITEDLTTALSGLTNLFVISRNSAFTYKGRKVKVEDVGRELGVRYVLEGSVRRAGDRVRITAQLIDATTGFHVWSEKYDRDLADVFAVQSEISEQILGEVGASITSSEVERIRRKPTESESAYDAYARGMFEFLKFRKDAMAAARRHFERAVEIDPLYAVAHSSLGGTYSAARGLFWTLDPAALERARQHAERALELDPGLGPPHFVRATIALTERNYSAALTHLAAAKRAAPSDYQPYIFEAVTYANLGRSQEAFEAIRTAFRLNPVIEGAPQMQAILGGVHANLGDDDEAVRLWEESRAGNPDLIFTRLYLADHYQARGETERARALIQEVLEVTPELSVDAVMRGGIGGRVLPDPEAFARNLRAAGLP